MLYAQMDSGDYVKRVEVFRSGQSLMLRVPDLSVSRLAAVFKLKPQSVFLEAEGSRNVEFPEEGRFKLVDTGPGMKYIVCGDPDAGENAPSVAGFVPSSQPGPSNPSSSGWSIPRPWALLNNQKGNQLSRSKKTLPMSNAAMLKRTFPYVSLSLDHTGKNITVESTIDSVYIKIPESSVCASNILEEVAIRVGSVAEDLVILDAKFLPVSNDERDLEYWKMPSRRFYIAGRTEFQNLRRTKGKALSLSRKRKVRLEEDEEDEDEPSLGRIAQDLQMVVKEVSDLKCDLVTIKNLQLDCEAARRRVRVDMGVEQLRLLDCKICKDTPSPPVVLVTCCKQLLGCEACFRNCMEQSECCPLCRNPDTDSIVVEGLDAVYSYLKQSMEITDNHPQ